MTGANQTTTENQRRLGVGIGVHASTAPGARATGCLQAVATGAIMALERNGYQAGALRRRPPAHAGIGGRGPTRMCASRATHPTAPDDALWMMPVAQRQRQIFMTPADEDAFCEVLRAKRPKLRILDDNVWPGSTPVMRVSVSACETRFAYVWDPEICPDILTSIDSHGRLCGGVRPLLQFERSWIRDGVLLAGRLAAGFETASEEAFVRDAFAALRRTCQDRVAATGATTPASMFTAGRDAAARAREGEFVLGSRSTGAHFVPMNPPERRRGSGGNL